MCGSNHIAQEELHDVNPRCQECKNALRLQLEEEERQQTAEDNALARRDEPSSGESLFSREDTEETSICTPRNDWFECNYPRVVICSQCQQPHNRKEGCRPQDMKSREKIQQEDVVRYANTASTNDPLNGHYGRICNPLAEDREVSYYDKRYLVYFPELQEHYQVHFKYIVKIDFNPFGSSEGNMPQYDEDGSSIIYDNPGEEVFSRVNMRNGVLLAPCASARVIDPDDGRSICSFSKRSFIKLRSESKCIRCGSSDENHKNSICRYSHYAPFHGLQYGACVQVKNKTLRITSKYNFTEPLDQTDFHRKYGRVLQLLPNNQIQVWFQDYPDSFLTFARHELTCISKDSYLKSGASFEDIIGPTPIQNIGNDHSPLSDQGIPRCTMTALTRLNMQTRPFTG